MTVVIRMTFCSSHRHAPGTYSIYLCAASCAEVLQDDTLFIAVYDQDGVMLDGTQIGVFEEQRVRIELNAGLAY